MGEDCIQCGRLAAEGSDLCSKCLQEQVDYEQWETDLKESYKR